MTKEALLVTDLHPSRWYSIFRFLSRFNRQSISISRLLTTLLTTIKSFSWKRPVKFLICGFIVPYFLFSAYCPIWLALQSESYTEKSMNETPLCPCQVSIMWDGDQFGFNVDPSCDARKSGYWNCRFHQGAKGCYRRKSTKSAAGAQCCYDKNGIWIADWNKGAGTLDMYYPQTLTTISTYQHFFSDVLSYFSCCIGASKILNSCEHYMKYRPPGKCEHLLLTPVYASGDPDSLTLTTSPCRLNEYC
ncbi:unnamed protein product [Rotaria socialis]|uniref:AMOP domain-containing protein n=3 Tax=Rotaria socialis TaxID=392032 RepID=A0A819XVQ7_9BILA|nr:unnamed protein product [Rotaria socialis]CAF4149098.1 unnamed protein product [Rotaria socialis]CAF4352349.1 unnamed protein product [Rotaria socialis]CAF4719966.1 unnamed protein product [Rotaria socialis]